MLAGGLRRQDGIREFKQAFDLVQFPETAGNPAVVTEGGNRAPEIPHAHGGIAQTGQKRGTRAGVRPDPEIVPPSPEFASHEEHGGKAVAPGRPPLVVLVDRMEERMRLKKRSQPLAYIKIDLRIGKGVGQRLKQRQRQHRVP